MRRVLSAPAFTAPVLAAVLIFAAACSGDGGRTASGGASPTVSASPGSSATTAPAGPGGSTAGAPTATAGGNAREVCVAAQKSTSQAVMVFVSELGTMMQASSANDTKGAQEAQRKAEAALAGWARAVREQGAKATDPQLKTVLGELGAEIGGMKAELDRVDQTRLDQLQQRLDQLCGS
ncbi:hypothetical protein [Micromonospora sp. NPDC049679]|uniref:hypothetical protein n=1 Tax=Micromonospora sp. NPDC049679 TaxID=3155920 RepID=UPI0033F86425